MSRKNIISYISDYVIFMGNSGAVNVTSSKSLSAKIKNYARRATKMLKVAYKAALLFLAMQTHIADFVIIIILSFHRFSYI